MKSVDYKELFIQAEAAEHGLNREIDLEDAEELYKQAFNKGQGILRAGNYLARIYQKQGKEEKAVSLYK